MKRFVLVAVAACTTGRAPTAAPPHDEVTPPASRALVLELGTSNDAGRRRELFGELVDACKRSERPACVALVSGGAGIDFESRRAAARALSAGCSSSFLAGCRHAQSSMLLADEADQALRTQCEGNVAAACFALADHTNDQSGYEKACNLGDPDACLKGARMNASLSRRAMELRRKWCDGGDGWSCLQLAQDVADPAQRDDALRRAKVNLVDNCLSFDAEACANATLVAPDDRPLEVRTIGCALVPAQCRDLARLLASSGNEREAARVFEHSCLTSSPGVSYQWQGSDCHNAVELIGKTRGAGARLRVVLQRECKLTQQGCSGADTSEDERR